ncbi:MAG TPA: hypothetical protein VHS76_04070 [Steroidobacteraceae bacterium]|jgi:hypothetical protein|nr:hypothetical protein [Steroidobacteraceae bacterium]
MAAYLRIAGVIIAGVTLFGCAATPPNAAKPATAALKDPNCLTQTGSRISSQKCLGYGRSYSDQDIQRTGQTDAADALGLLDPSITVHH